MTTWDELVEQVARQIHEQKMKAGDISPEMVKSIAKDLMGGVFAGYGKNFESKELGATDFEMLRALEENVYVFSGFKNYQQLRECTDLLKDSEGNIRSFDEFLKDVRTIDATYSRVYALAEYNHALTTSTMISKWQTFTKEKGALPYLKYDAVNDDRTRAEHKALDGVVAKVDSPFWKTYYPPNGWNCRCDVVQLSEGEETNLDTVAVPDVPKMFQNNAGIDGVVFPKGHPYFADVERSKIPVIETSAKKIWQEVDGERLRTNQSFAEAHDALMDSGRLDNFPQLTELEGTAIHYYTRTGSSVLNQNLRKATKSGYTQILEQVLNRAISKLDTFGEPEVYRGTKMTQNQLRRYQRAKKSGKVITEKSFLSTSYKIKQAAAFHGSPGMTRVLFTVVHKDGKLIEELSDFEHEGEVLIKSKSKFKVVDIERTKRGKEGIYKIVLEQVE